MMKKFFQDVLSGVSLLALGFLNTSVVYAGPEEVTQVAAVTAEATNEQTGQVFVNDIEVRTKNLVETLLPNLGSVMAQVIVLSGKNADAVAKMHSEGGKIQHTGATPAMQLAENARVDLENIMKSKQDFDKITNQAVKAQYQSIVDENVKKAQEAGKKIKESIDSIPNLIAQSKSLSPKELLAFFAQHGIQPSERLTHILNNLPTTTAGRIAQFFGVGTKSPTPLPPPPQNLPQASQKPMPKTDIASQLRQFNQLKGDQNPPTAIPPMGSMANRQADATTKERMENVKQFQLPSNPAPVPGQPIAIPNAPLAVPKQPIVPTPIPGAAGSAGVKTPVTAPANTTPGTNNNGLKPVAYGGVPPVNPPAQRMAPPPIPPKSPNGPRTEQNTAPSQGIAARAALFGGSVGLRNNLPAKPPVR